MKLIIFILIAMCCFISASSQVTKLQEYNQSLSAWRNLQAYSYTYIAPFSSWSGYRAQTTITVINGKVTQREFQSYQMNLDPEVQLDHWVETGENIGSHQQGAPARTMEENYKYCSEEVLTKDPNENSIYFGVDERGILKQCAYFPHNCADDCLTGITIEKTILN